MLCNTFTGTGSLSSNGGDGKSQGGGGAGGRVYVHFTSGDFKSGHVSAHGRFKSCLFFFFKCCFTSTETVKTIRDGILLVWLFVE